MPQTYLDIWFEGAVHGHKSQMSGMNNMLEMSKENLFNDWKKELVGFPMKNKKEVIYFRNGSEVYESEAKELLDKISHNGLLKGEEHAGH